MTKKKSTDELADEILRDFDAGDTPVARAQAALGQARDAGGGGVRQQYLRTAQRHIAEIDPWENHRGVQQLQAEVLALQGRGGDTRIAHVTPNEVVLPRWAQTPAVMNALAAVARSRGIDPATFRVGSGRNRINPRTGQMEFDDSEDRWSQTPDAIDYHGTQDGDAPQNGNTPSLPPLESLRDFHPSLEGPDPTDEITKDYQLHRIAEAIYGETGALLPQSLDPNKRADDPNNWNPDSAKKLHDARVQIGAMYGTVNRRMVPQALPMDNSGSGATARHLALAAAQDAMNTSSDPRYTNMAMHQKDIGPQSVTTWPGLGNLDSAGPFINPLKATQDQINRGKAIGYGPNAFIDFYGKN